MRRSGNQPPGEEKGRKGDFGKEVEAVIGKKQRTGDRISGGNSGQGKKDTVRP